MDYLREAGTYLTKHHGLCNVGQWHSHHKINLFKPSVGDENTVWSNMPNLGLDRYIVFIANIPNQVTINCFLFQIKKGKQLSVKHGEFEFLDGNSPVRLNEKVLQNVHCGAESFNQITRFEKEMKYIRNKDAIENLDISNKNEYETSSYTGNRVQHVTSVSVQQEKTKKHYTQEHTGTTEKQDKNKSKQKLSVSVYHTPTPESTSLRQPARFTGYGSQDSKQRISGSTIQRDPEQNNQSNRGPSAARNESTHSNTPSRSSWQPQDNRTTTPTTSGRSGKNENCQTTLKDTQKRLEHQGTTPKTNKQTSENSNFPTASQGMQWKQKEKTSTTSDQDPKYYNYPTAPEDRKGQREHKGITPKTTAQGPDNNYTGFATTGKDTHKQWELNAITPRTNYQGSKRYFSTTPNDEQKQRDLKETNSESGKLASTSQKEREQHIDNVGNKDQYPTTRRTTECAQQPQSPNVKFKGTDSRAMNVIVYQPEGFSGLRRSPGGLKRKSGDYDNVIWGNELPQRKSSRLNSVNIPPPQYKPEVIHERSSTPSGTFIPPEEVSHKFRQTEEINDSETTGSRLTRLYNSVCCRMSKLNINEPEVDEIRDNKVEDNDGSKVYV